MPFQPAIDEPSKKCPDSNLSGPKAFTGTLTCCSLPRVSVKRRSTNLTSLSLIVWNMSFGVIVFSLTLSKTRILFLIESVAENYRKNGEHSAINKKSLRPFKWDRRLRCPARHVIVPNFILYTAENSSVSTRNSAFHALRLWCSRGLCTYGVMGFRGKFTGPSDGCAMLNSHIGRAVRICLACIASD